MPLAAAVSLTDRQVNGLMAAYLTRKKFETQIMLSVVSEALKPKQEQASLASLAALGFGIQGAS